MSQFDRVLDTLQTTSPVSIIVLLPTSESVAEFQAELRDSTLKWHKIRRGFMEGKDGSRVILVTNDQARRDVQGYNVDYLSLHDEATWLAIQTLRPCARSLI